MSSSQGCGGIKPLKRTDFRDFWFVKNILSIAPFMFWLKPLAFFKKEQIWLWIHFLQFCKHANMNLLLNICFRTTIDCGYALWCIAGWYANVASCVAVNNSLSLGELLSFKKFIILLQKVVFSTAILWLFLRGKNIRSSTMRNTKFAQTNCTFYVSTFTFYKWKIPLNIIIKTALTLRHCKGWKQ